MNVGDKGDWKVKATLAVMKDGSAKLSRSTVEEALGVKPGDSLIVFTKPGAVGIRVVAMKDVVIIPTWEEKK